VHTRFPMPWPPSDILPMAAERSSSPSIDGCGRLEGELVFFSINASSNMATADEARRWLGGDASKGCKLGLCDAWCLVSTERASRDL
jgi:hypothetical protein